MALFALIGDHSKGQIIFTWRQRNVGARRATVSAGLLHGGTRAAVKGSIGGNDNHHANGHSKFAVNSKTLLLTSNDRCYEFMEREAGSWQPSNLSPTSRSGRTSKDAAVAATGIVALSFECFSAALALFGLAGWLLS